MKKITLLKSLTVENYKAFRETQNIKINNITLLFGYNNTGKSALLRALPLLADSFKKKTSKYYTESYINYNSPSIRGALFNDIKNQNSRTLSFGLEWDNGYGLNFNLQQDGSEKEKIKKLTIKKNGNSKDYRESIDYASTLENVDDSIDIIKTNGFSFSNEIELNKLTENFSESIHWISSTRIHPPREFEIGVGIPIGVKPDGDGTGETIWFLSEAESISYQDVNGWLLDTCGRVIDTTSSSSSVTRDGRKRVKLETVAVTKDAKDETSPIRVAILDSGEGIAQALPVVTLCAMAANNELGDNPIIVIEQPELHLHPKATITLADFIVKCINKNKNAKYVIETHSESFLLALQLAIVDDKLKTDDFNCYWVDRNNSGSLTNEVTFDDSGYITNNWPQSVFREVINQSKELINKRIAKDKS